MIDQAPQVQVIEQLAHCGLKAEGLHIAFDDLLQSDVVTVTRRAGGSASMFTCIRHVAWARVDLAFEDESLGAAYRSYDQAVGYEEMRTQARAWLAERGLLDALPTLAEGEDPRSIIEKIERFCSIEPGTALELHGTSMLTQKRDFLTLPPPPQSECLMNAMMVIDLEKHGLSFGFVGNEAVGESNEE